LCERKEPDDLLFADRFGGFLRRPSASNNRRSWFLNARTQAGLERLTPHDLRHTAASLAVSSGANVKAVQRMLGHKSAAMTLDTYADLFDDDLDAVAMRLDAGGRQKNVGKVWAQRRLNEPWSAELPRNHWDRGAIAGRRNWRRMGDSNPRGLAPNTLSKRAP
jgi:hypothetical protein